MLGAKHYLGVAERADGNWSVSFPAFPGTVTTGDTIAELYAHAKDALGSVIEAMQEDGLAIPESFEDLPETAEHFRPSDYLDPHVMIVPVEVCGKALRINVTMDEALVARVDRFAGRVHSSRSAILARGARLVLAAEMAE
jgi:predicted RNase H-like HicB family nuclease